MKTYTKFLFAVTLAYFALGFVNIHFAVLGLICMTVPLVLLFKNTKKTWCQGVCPRASLFSSCGKITKSFSYKTPKFFVKGNMKWIVLSYFVVSLLFIAVSTVKVAGGSAASMEYLRFLMIFPIKAALPQLIEFSGIAPWITHFAYRFYSMMMTTTVLGLIFALVYRPRTWCTICPISTISDAYINSKRKSQKNMGINCEARTTSTSETG